MPIIERSSKVHTCELGGEETYLQGELLRLIPNLSLHDIISHPKWISLQSARLHHGAFVVLDYDLIRPIFGKILDIACIAETYVLCVLEFYGNLYNSHYNS